MMNLRNLIIIAINNTKKNNRKNNKWKNNKWSL